MTEIDNPMLNQNLVETNEVKQINVPELRVAVVGNVDCDLLARGDKEEIKKEVLNLIKRVSSTGGHILSSANTISSSIKPDNFMEMLNICKDYGVYPIN